MELGPAQYLAIFAASVTLCWALTPIALKVALRSNLLDRPGSYKIQSTPIPYLGGAAIATAFGVAVLLAAVVAQPGARLQDFPLIMMVAIGLAVMGLFDDIYGLHMFLRFGIEVLAGLTLWFAGVQILLFDIPVIDAVLTILWIVGVTNAFNLLDNMDGLSAGTAAIAAGGFFVIAALNGQFLVAGLSVALSGCAIGFLRHNFHPARIYMGDAGSLFLGFLLSVIAIKLRFQGPVQVTFMVPVLVLSVPIFDTVLVTVSRLLHRRSPLSGGRDHTSHRLVMVGIPIRAAVGLIYFAGLASTWTAIVMSRIDRISASILMGLVISVALFLALMLGAVPVYESSKRRRMMIQEIIPHEDPAEVEEIEERAQAAN